MANSGKLLSKLLPQKFEIFLRDFSFTIESNSLYDTWEELIIWDNVKHMEGEEGSRQPRPQNRGHNVHLEHLSVQTYSVRKTLIKNVCPNSKRFSRGV